MARPPTLDDVLSFELTSLGEERAHARFTIDDRHRQPCGLVHGGVYAALAESLASDATAQVVDKEGCIARGLSNATSFFRPVADGTVRAEAERIHRGRTTWVWDVRFTDEAGRVCAASRVTIAVRQGG
jgi:1,4-dihydroxy-2-naphthoyl-CoA hydrolase